MMLLYYFAIKLYGLALHLAAHFHPKAQEWVRGRKQWRRTLAEKVKGLENPVWMHCASLGEFEQGRPILEALREEFPEAPVLLTFFSPSGYKLRKNTPLAERVLYLPLDSPGNARFFLTQVKPRLALFVKYDFWYFFLRECRRRDIPLVLCAGLFRPGQIFFRSYGGFFRRMLSFFNHLLVQDEASAKILREHGIERLSVTGDPRIDRVAQLAQRAEAFPKVATFCENSPVLIFGSTHSPDEELLLHFLKKRPPTDPWKYILAPHDIHKKRIEQLMNELPLPAQRYSSYQPEDGSRVLIIDNIGMLSRLYQYGQLAYIGGGFGRGIHNTLEPFSFGLPVAFGPNYEKFEEARQMVEAGGAKVVKDATALQHTVTQWEKAENWRKASDIVQSYIKNSRGATQRSMQILNQYVT